MAILECKALSKSYGLTKAVDSADIKIEAGRVVGLLGPNGSGKTTLIKLAAGLLSPTSGEVLIEGMAPGPETKAIVSYLSDRDYLPDWMNLNQLLDYFGDFYSDFNREKAIELSKRIGVVDDKPLKTLSKGTREKLQLVLVMSRDAKLFLLDEPIGGVDPATRDTIIDTIIKNYNPDAAVIISTHIITDIEKILDDVIFINEGKISLVESVDDIRAKHQKSVDAYFREVYKC